MHIRLHYLSMASSWECDVDGIPEPPDWTNYTKHLKLPSRLLLIAYPCCGIVGSQEVTKGLLHQACNVFDLEESYREALEQIFKNCPELPTLHLGTDVGNVLSAALQNLTCPDAIVSGPPCPPWAGHGKKSPFLMTGAWSTPLFSNGPATSSRQAVCSLPSWRM